MEAPNAFILLSSCDLFTLITSGNLIGTIENPLRGVYLIRCTIILTNECHRQFNTPERRMSIMNGQLWMNGDEETFGHTLKYGTSFNAEFKGLS